MHEEIEIDWGLLEQRIIRINDRKAIELFEACINTALNKIETINEEIAHKTCSNNTIQAYFTDLVNVICKIVSIFDVEIISNPARAESFSILHEELLKKILDN